MKKLPAVIAVLAAAIAGSIIAAYAASPSSYPTKAFDATYERSNSAGVSQYRMCTDGKGHMRTETELPGQSRKEVVIFDYPRSQMLMLLDQQKLVMKMPLTGDANLPADEVKIKALGGVSLGTKVIDGHPCHGWKYASAGKSVQTWTADDLGCMIASATYTSGDREVLHLLTFTPSAPPPDTFKTPADYKEVAGYSAH